MSERKYPITIIVNGRPEQVKPMGKNLFCSKKQIFSAEYDHSGNLRIKVLGCIADTAQLTGQLTQ